MSKAFDLQTEFEPAGQQPAAIEALCTGIDDGLAYQTLLGVTGSGKTFTIANVIQQKQRPAIVLAPNKTLAAQLYGEFKAFFPNNSVEYFVSYYDYYQPEAYVPARQPKPCSNETTPLSLPRCHLFTDWVTPSSITRWCCTYRAGK